MATATGTTGVIKLTPGYLLAVQSLHFTLQQSWCASSTVTFL